MFLEYINQYEFITYDSTGLVFSYLWLYYVLSPPVVSHEYSVWRICEQKSSYMKNRLGRIKYHKEYNTLSEDVIDDIIEDMLINKEHKQSIKDVFSELSIVSIDILVNIINDMNLFNESAFDVVKHLNLQSESKYYDITEIFKNQKIKQQTLSLELPGDLKITPYRFSAPSFENLIKKYKEDESLSELDKQFIKDKIDDQYYEYLEFDTENYDLVEKSATHFLFKYKFADSYYILFEEKSKKTLLF